MLYWIKRGSSLFGSAAFFVVLLSLLIRPGAIEYPAILVVFGIAFFAGLVCWFFGAVVCDIMIKGMVIDIGQCSPEQLVEGGILQQLHMLNEQNIPGGKDMPFVPVSRPADTGGSRKKV